MAEVEPVGEDYLFALKISLEPIREVAEGRIIFDGDRIFQQVFDFRGYCLF